MIAQLSDGPHPECGTIGRVVERVVDGQNRTSDGTIRNVEVKVNRHRLRPASVAQERIEALRREISRTLGARLLDQVPGSPESCILRDSAARTRPEVPGTSPTSERWSGVPFT